MNVHVATVKWASHPPDTSVVAGDVKYIAEAILSDGKVLVGKNGGSVPFRPPLYVAHDVLVFPAPVGSPVMIWKDGTVWKMIRPEMEYDDFIDPCEELEEPE